MHTKEDAEELLALYVTRWTVDQFFRILENGCEAEAREFLSVDDSPKSLPIDAAVAWRVLSLMTEGRQSPDLPCTVDFAKHEWQTAWAFVNRAPKPPESPPKAPRHSGKWSVWSGALGGHLGRKHDGPQGQQKLWRGLHRLLDLVGMRLMLKRPSSEALERGSGSRRSPHDLRQVLSVDVPPAT